MKTLVLTTMGVLGLIFTLFSMANLWGRGQRHPEYKHPFFDQAPLVGIQCLQQSACKNELASLPPEKTFVSVTLAASSEGQLIVTNENQKTEFLLNRQKKQSESSTTLIYRGHNFADYSLAEIKEVIPSIELWNEFKTLHTGRWHINLLENTALIDAVIEKQFPETAWNDRVVFSCPALVVTEAIKHKKPAWLYGTAWSDLMRLITFESLFLLPTTQLIADVFIAPYKLQNRVMITPGVLGEIRRRNKKIILGPINDLSEWNLIKDFDKDAVIFRSAFDYAASQWKP